MKKRSAAGVLLWILTALVFAALLELNKNTLLAWAETAGILLLYAVLRRRGLRDARFGRRALAYAGLVALLTLVLLGVGRPGRLRPAVAGTDGGMTEIVTVAQGKLRGVKTADGAVEVYAGIPYAAPPLGELRWKAPQDPASWEDVRSCNHFAPMAMQPRNSEIYNSLSQIIGFHDYRISLEDNFRDMASEDALYLNLWKPAGGGDRLPVLVYVHGGALQTGQPWYADYSGEGLARKGVIVVNFGYRLGVFGFLATEELAAEDPRGSTGNYGLMDQIKALEWVRDNIAAFGGDPDNVTLAGESAGAACVTALCTSPEAKGLFRRAVAESSTTTAPEPQHSFRTLDEALETGRETMARFGAKSIAELRKVDAKKLAAAADTNHHLTVDGFVLPRTPYEAYAAGEHNEEAVLHGFNALEGTPFLLFERTGLKNYASRIRGYFGDAADEVLSLYPASTDAEANALWTELYSAVYFTHGHYCWSRQALACGVPCYEYYFTKSNGRLGPWHSGEEVYLYNNIPADSPLYDARDRELADLCSEYYVNFIKTGDPNGPGLPRWEASRDGTQLMELGETEGMIEDPYLPIDRVLDRMQGWEDTQIQADND